MRRGELVAVACAGGAMPLTMVFFGGWLSRFELIRLRRISLATLPRYGLMDGYQYVYCLPPATASHKGGVKVWAEGWVEGWT
jgi:hypothetical protein